MSDIIGQLNEKVRQNEEVESRMQGEMKYLAKSLKVY